jgi:hypothetical protein
LGFRASLVRKVGGSSLSCVCPKLTLTGFFEQPNCVTPLVDVHWQSDSAGSYGFW